MECILTVVSRVSVTARPGWTKTRRLYTFWFCLSERASAWCCTRSLRRGRPSPWTRRYTSSPPSSGASSPPDRHRSRKRSPEERNKQDKLKTHRSRVRKMIQNLHSPAQCKKNTPTAEPNPKLRRLFVFFACFFSFSVYKWMFWSCAGKHKQEIIKQMSKEGAQNEARWMLNN